MALVGEFERRIALLAASSAWNPLLHPRAKDGKFIEVGGWVKAFFRIDNQIIKLTGKVKRIEKNPKDDKNPVVWVETSKNGVRPTLASFVQESAMYKAQLETPAPGEFKTWKNEKPYSGSKHVPSTSHGLFDWSHKQPGYKPKPYVPPPPPKPLPERIADAKARVNEDAEKLDTKDPYRRAGQLNKIMSGVRGSPLSTVVQYNEQGASRDGWDLLRAAEHEKLWAEFLKRVLDADVPKERDAIVMGGPAGSGKTWSLQAGMPVAEKFGVVTWDGIGDPPEGVTHVTLNPDSLKEMMIDAGMLPDGISEKIKPMEQVSFIHAESNFLVALFFRRLGWLGYNVVYDTTMANMGHMEKNLGPLAEADYSFRGAWVDIPKQESRISALNRYVKDWQTDLGGRFVPSDGGSGSFTTFQQMASWFEGGWITIDNSGISKGNPAWDVYGEGYGDGSGLRRYRTIRAAANLPVPCSETQMLRAIRDTSLDPQDALVMLARNEVLVSEAVGPTTDWDDEAAAYASKSTMFHEVPEADWPEFDEALARLRSEGHTIGTALTAAMDWDPTLHPRGRDGRFIEVGGWVRGLFSFVKGNKRKMTRGRVIGFHPNEKDPKNPIVAVETDEGPAIALTSEISEVEEAKAHLGALPEKPKLGDSIDTHDGFRIAAVNGGRYIITPPAGWVDDLGTTFGTPGARSHIEIAGWDKSLAWIEKVRDWQPRQQMPVPTAPDTRAGAWDLKPGDIAYVPVAGGTYKITVERTILTGPGAVMIYGEHERIGDLPAAQGGTVTPGYLVVDPATPVLIEPPEAAPV